MKIKYDIDVDVAAIQENLKRIINQIFKLLPLREEGGEWQASLQTVIEELAGMSRLFAQYQIRFFSLLCKLEGLYFLIDEEDFLDYRKTIFECLNTAAKLREEICQD